MVIGFIPISNSLGIHDQHINFLSIGRLALNISIPHPDPFGVGIHRGSQPITAVEDDSVKEVGLTGPVESGHGHHTNGGRHCRQEFSPFHGELVL
jgi:hypothetical protein